MNDREIQILLKLKDDMSKTLDGVEKNTEKSTNKMMGFFKVGLVGAIGTVGVALGKLAVDSINFGVDAENAQRKLQSQLGITEKEAEELGQVAQDVWANNFGGNIAEVTESISIAERNMKDFVDATNMQGVVEDAYRLADAYDIGIGESTMAANTLMKEFGLTSDEAFDFITSGMQKGLNSSDDFLDSITEYGPQFREGGADAGEFFSVMETGMQDGMLGTDKVSDGFKELRLGLVEAFREGSKLEPMFDDIGLNAADMGRRMAEGNLSVTDAYHEIEEALMGIEDEAERAALSQEIFGTMGEDAANMVKLGIDDTKTSLEDMMGSNDELNSQYDTLGALMQGTWRDLVIEMQPAVDKFLEIANVVLPLLIGKLGELVTFIGDVIKEVENLVDWWAKGIEKGDLLVITLTSILVAIGLVKGIIALYSIAVGIATVATALFAGAIAILTSPVTLVIAAIAAVIAIGMLLAAHWDEIKAKAAEIWEDIKMRFERFKNDVGTIFENVKAKATEVWGGIKDSIDNAINGAKDIVVGVVDEIKRTIESVIDSIEGVVGAARELPGKVGGFLDNLNPTTGSGFLSGVFQNGGIVGGNSFTGDNLVVGVNSGEMILNRQQQANLFDMIQAGNTTNNNNSRNIDTVIINTNEGFNTFMQELAL